jgi:DNA polymerase-3 subunit delta
LKLPLRQLSRHLSQDVAGIYLVAADEPLLVGEATDAIRAAARSAGFDEREVMTVERGFRWESVNAATDSLSLFGSRKIIELRMRTPRPGDAGARAIRALAEAQDPDRLIVIVIDTKLDASAARSVWVRTIENHGVVLQIWPVERGELPQWIAQRARRYQIELTRGAAELLAERAEGNLLAADQELHKLALVGYTGAIDEAEVLDHVSSSARFDVFRLSDAVLAGDATRAIRVLDGLRAEGTHPTLIAWALVRELDLVGRLHGARSSGENPETALGRMRVWKRRWPLLKRAAQRWSRNDLAALVRQAGQVDRTIKGVVAGHPWSALTGLVLAAVEPRSRWLSG